ncbi:MAG: Lipoprotein-releasing system ATP-binding protein LolD [Planctomycetes bacterium ADurb.Bin412]|nr:MAG: Lipoprotein-releasing system ATP-binding protein LolD [Planctomycetes bacterium ADurb.Bin412]
MIRTRALYKDYPMGRDKLHVLRGVNLEVRRGEFLAIMGASGSGKSTLLHILGLLDRPDRGEVELEGQPVFHQSQARQDRIRNKEIGFVFQFYHLLPELNVEENVLLPEMVGNSLWNWVRRRKTTRRQAREVIESVGLEKQIHQRPATLSGGERQRVAIARALVQRPKLLLADEPTGNLDSVSGKVILDIFGRLNQAGQTIVMVTHDAKVAALAHRKLDLIDGKIQ